MCAQVKAPVPMVDQPAAGPVDQELDAPASPIRRRSPPHAPLMKGISSGDDNGQIRRRKEHARSLSPTRGRPKIGRRPWPRSRGAVAQVAPPEVSGLVDALEESPLRPAAHALAPPHPGPQLPLFCSRPSPKVPSEARRRDEDGGAGACSTYLVLPKYRIVGAASAASQSTEVRAERS